MRPPGNESRPQADLKAAKSFGGDKSIVTHETPAVIDGAPAVVIFDAARSRAEDISRRLIGAPRGEREAYFEGRADGFVDGERVGFQRGRQAERDEIDSLHRAAHRVVAAMVRLPERNRRDEEWLSGSRAEVDGDDVRVKDIVARSSVGEDRGDA